MLVQQGLAKGKKSYSKQGPKCSSEHNKDTSIHAQTKVPKLSKKPHQDRPKSVGKAMTLSQHIFWPSGITFL